MAAGIYKKKKRERETLIKRFFNKKKSKKSFEVILRNLPITSKLTQDHSSPALKKQKKNLKKSKKKTFFRSLTNLPISFVQDFETQEPKKIEVLKRFFNKRSKQSFEVGRTYRFYPQDFKARKKEIMNV